MITYPRLAIQGFYLGFGFKSDSAGENSAESAAYFLVFQENRRINCMCGVLPEEFWVRLPENCTTKEKRIITRQRIRNVPPNGVFGNKVYGSDLEGFGRNPSSNEFRLCNSDEWRSGNHGGRVIIRGYDGGGDMVVHHGVKGVRI
ncbi:hypothetical protein Tco_1345440 [Tanacetum coccineum]